MKTQPSYRQAMEELDGILTSMENGTTDFDQLSKQLKRAAELIRFCRQKLKETDAEIQAIFAGLDEENTPTP